MSITLEMLSAAATGSATRAASRAFHTLSVEEARGSAKIKDGNRKPAEDGSQKLTVVIGKHTLPMDCIKAGTSRIAVTADQIVGYTEAIQGLIDNGSFDEAIEKAQGLAKAQYEKATNKAPAPAPEATEGLDLDALEEGDAQVDADEEL
jgi:hypothetical protein